MKLKEIYKKLLSERRSRGISLDKASKIFRKHCYGYQASNTQIFRGVSNFTEEQAIVRPEQTDKRRKSAHTENYYTLIIDNSEDWNRYPDRGLSIVCSTTPVSAKAYGKLYLVIPFNGANIGVAPEFDIWESFNFNLPKFNNTIILIGSEASMYDNFPYSPIPPHNSAEKLKEYIETADEFLERVKYPDTSNKTGYDYLLKKISERDEHVDFISDYLNSNYESLYEYLEYLLDPERNGFELQNYGPNFSLSERHEVWTDSPSLLIKDDNVMNFFDKVNEEWRMGKIDTSKFENNGYLS